MAKTWPVRFGWCETNEHDKCIGVLPSYPDLYCTCDCHEGDNNETKTSEADT